MADTRCAVHPVHTDGCPACTTRLDAERAAARARLARLAAAARRCP